MPRLVCNALTVAQVRCASKSGILVDGNGLMLRVQKSGAKSWVQRIMIHGRRRDIGLGAADLVSLAEARETAARNRAIARNGGDPRRPRVPSFAQAEAQAFERAALDWKGGADSPTARDWRARMATYVLPQIGHIPVDQIGTAVVDDVLRPLAMAGKHPTARAAGSQRQRLPVPRPGRRPDREPRHCGGAAARRHRRHAARVPVQLQGLGGQPRDPARAFRAVPRPRRGLQDRAGVRPRRPAREAQARHAAVGGLSGRGCPVDRDPARRIALA